MPKTAKKKIQMPPSIYRSNQPTETVVVSHKKIASIDSSKKNS